MSDVSVLVVEDEALIADDLERTLRRLGYSVSGVAADGKGAIAAATSKPPAVVLMDIKLKGPMDGVDAARVLRDQVDAPIVFLTSHSDDGTLSRASEVRPEGYVMKPFVERELRVAIELALHKHEVSRALSTREHWFSSTLQSLREGVVTTDERCNVTFLNQEAERLTGWSTTSAAGRPVDEVLRFVSASGDVVEPPAREALARREPVSLAGPLLLQSADQAAPVPVDDSVAPILGPGGQALGTVVVFRDVTRQRELEQRLARHERLASLGTMAAGICHEINNPLAAVIANTESALESMRREGLPEALLEPVADACSAAERIGDIVRAMRTFAQPGDAPMSAVALPAVLDQALTLSAHALRGRASVVRRLDDVASTVLGNATQLVQVFVNLLVNAAQAIEPGPPSRHSVTVRLRAGGPGEVVVEVQDDGAGIPREVLPRVFDPFFTTKGPGGGMGLGLSITHRLVETHGGRITVESERGRGTTFRVTLPLAPAA